jgi:TPR repeat protein
LYIVAFIWLKKAADNGVIEGLAYIGYMYMHGDGVTQNSTIGVTFTVMAAEGGSDMACCQLGLWFAEGRHGLNVKTTPAKHFLQKGTSGFCLYTHCNKALKV